MPLQRRNFLRASLAAAFAGLPGCRRGPEPEVRAPTKTPTDAAPPPSRPAPEGPPSVLILGGTGFLGPHVVEAARARGYAITLFNRGKTNPQLFPDVEKLRGDRNGDLKSIADAIAGGRRWSAVIDTSGYFPRIVRDSAALVAPATDQYVFISSISVYSSPNPEGVHEGDPVGQIDDPSVEKITETTYGPLKALSEAAAEAAMPGKTTNVRPGLIVGPGDPTDRFTYWPVRATRPGPMIAPGGPADPIQFIDGRDLATWLLECVAARHYGLYNAVGPASPVGIGDLVDASVRNAAAGAEPVWIPAEFLMEHEVMPWVHMPAWVPAASEDGGLAKVDSSKAIAAGLTYRGLEAIVADTLEWWKTLPEERRAKMRAGVSPEKEAEVLAAWAKRGAKGGKAKAAAKKKAA
ncbi:MAG: epimerase [Nannocystaceae bacterium]